MPASGQVETLNQLLAQRKGFERFVRARVGSAAEAEEIVQMALAKVPAHAGELRDDAKLIAWFYQILRHVIADFERSRTAARARETRWAAEQAAEAEAPRDLCRCFEPLLDALKREQAELLRKVELEGLSVAEAAASLGLTPNHASVLLHRGRAALRARLQALCGACAEGACLDCDCEPRAARNAD